MRRGKGRSAGAFNVVGIGWGGGRSLVMGLGLGAMELGVVRVDRGKHWAVFDFRKQKIKNGMIVTSALQITSILLLMPYVLSTKL